MYQWFNCLALKKNNEIATIYASTVFFFLTLHPFIFNLEFLNNQTLKFLAT